MTLLFSTWLRAVRTAYRAITLARSAQCIAYRADRRSEDNELAIAEAYYRIGSQELRMTEVEQRICNAHASIWVVRDDTHSQALRITDLESRLAQMEDRFSSRTDVMSQPSLN